jgi:trimethylamine corrinoid protein
MQIPPEFQSLATAIENGSVPEGVSEATKLNQAGFSVVDIFEKAIVPCLQEIGDRFSRLDIFLPEMMRSAEVVKAIQKALESSLGVGQSIHVAGKVVIGTTYGDIHDIGKNIVASMLEVNGFEVFDLGVSVAGPDFIRRAREANADIIAASSLLTTSIPYMADLIEQVNANESDRKRFKILVGGGPMTAERAKEIGADAFGKDASEAVVKARELMSSKE